MVDVIERDEQTSVVQQSDAPVQDPTAQQNGKQVRLRVDEREMATAYANAFRTNGSAEEVMLDFGINAVNPSSKADAATDVGFKVSNRIILNYYSAKRLALTLSQMIRRHEEQFGPLEMDVAKRKKNAH